MMNKIDIMYLGSKKHNNFKKSIPNNVENELNSELELKNDIIKYKKRIIEMNKTIINSLLDNSNILQNNDNIKFISYYKLYLLSVIEYFKVEDFYKNNQSDLNKFLLDISYNMGLSNVNLSNVDLSNIDLSNIDLSNCILSDIKIFKNMNYKYNNINDNILSFVTNKNQQIKKILPTQKKFYK
jgi:uncharacterized protein YjbI with pentapeptide repeats